MSETTVDVLAERFDDAGCEPMVLLWYVKEGDGVAEGDEMCEVESAKAVVVVTAPATGTVAQICIGEGEAVESGQVLARIVPDAAAGGDGGGQ